MIRVVASLLGAALALAAATAAAQGNWPERTIRLVVPYPPGGNVDGAARIIADRLQQLLGQPVVIENKPGAGGLVAGELVTKSAPDGYTLLLGANGPILFAPELAGRRAYEWRKDLVPISTISITPIVLQVHPSVPARTLREFFELVRTQPGKLNMASPGVGTSNHLMSELMQSRLGLSWMTVQYKGNAPATSDLIAGHVQFNLDQMSVALPFIKDGKTRGLAVTGDQRLKSLSDVPTFREAGHPEIDGVTFTALMAPAGTPEQVVDKLHATLTSVLTEAGVAARFEALGAQARPMTRQAFTAYLEKEDATWIPIIRKGNIRAP
jgi:tripartite-type tricarboxylate transporter receptor subunit TctC